MLQKQWQSVLDKDLLDRACCGTGATKELAVLMAACEQSASKMNIGQFSMHVAPLLLQTACPIAAKSVGTYRSSYSCQSSRNHAKQEV
jgi:hypothetical protein